MQYAIRLRSSVGEGYTSALTRGATACFFIDLMRGWAILPERNNAVLTLRELQEHWDELRIQIDVRSGSEPWREISDWNEIAKPMSQMP